MLDRTEAAYWLALSFALTGERRRDRNGLVLTAHRNLGLGLLDLVRLDRLPDELAQFQHTWQRLLDAEPQVSGLAFLVDELRERGIDLVPITGALYPAHLARTLSPSAAPTVLSVAGAVGNLAQPGVCISGSRKAGPSGLAFARGCGEALARAGTVVVSGLAAGPDREALAGALDAGGRAIGVAPEGILQARGARDPMVREGRLTVVSEFDPKQRWQRGLAMGRNRTLAGLSRALLVADCVAPGGTTHQVEVHLKLGLPVFVRRGDGEGAHVSTLAAVPGVRVVAWASGPVELPRDATVGASDPPPRAATPTPAAPTRPPSPDAELVDRRAELDQVEATLATRRSELAELDAAIARRHAELAALDRRQEGRGEDLLSLVRERDEPDYEPATADSGDAHAPPPGDATAEDDGLPRRVLELLAGATGGLSVQDVVTQIGISDRKARQVLKRMVEDQRLHVDKGARRNLYYAPQTTPAGLPLPAPGRPAT